MNKKAVNSAFLIIRRKTESEDVIGVIRGKIKNIICIFTLYKKYSTFGFFII